MWLSLPKVEADMNFCSMIRNLSTWSSSSLFTTSASFRASASLLLLLILPPIMLVLVRVRLRLFLLGIVVFVDPSMMSAMLLLLLFTDVDGESMSDASSLLVLIHESMDLLKKRNTSMDRSISHK